MSNTSRSNPVQAPGQSLAELVEVMKRLLAPDGCPWDREQTLDSLKPYLLEETYEVLEAIDSGDPDAHREELGDLLMQIVFQAALRERSGDFTIDDVVRGIADKLIRRHPHVFGEADVESSDQVVAQWAEIKAREKRERGAERDRALAGVPAALPALARAQQISMRAARVGFDWPDVAGCRAKVAEELEELDRAVAEGAPERVEAEIGDLLFAVVSLARKLDCDAEGALRRTTQRFIRRFEHIEDRLHEAGRSTAEAGLEEMDALWEHAKAQENQ